MGMGTREEIHIGDQVYTDNNTRARVDDIYVIIEMGIASAHAYLLLDTGRGRATVNVPMDSLRLAN